MDKWKAAIICTVVGICLAMSQEVPAVMVREIPAAVILWLLKSRGCVTKSRGCGS